MVGIRWHHVSHVRPPTLANGSAGDLFPALLVLDFRVGKELAGLREEENRVIVHALGFEHAFKLGPDRPMAGLLLGFLPRVGPGGQVCIFPMFTHQYPAAARS